MSHNLGLDWDADKTRPASPSSRGFVGNTPNHQHHDKNDNPDYTHTSGPNHDDTMKHDRSSNGVEAKDRRGFDPASRTNASSSNPHNRLRSPSPYSRRARTYKDEDHQRSDKPAMGRGDSTNHQGGGGNGHVDGTRASEIPPFRGEKIDDMDRGRPIPTSPRHGPASGKRRRSRSPPPFPPSRPKKSKRDRGQRNRPDRGPSKKFGHPRYERPTSPFSARSHSPNYESRDRYADQTESSLPHRSRRRSRSPYGHPGELDWGPPPPSHPRNDAPPRDHSQSPRPNSRRSSYSRTHSSPRPPTRPHAGSAEGGVYSRRSPPPYDAPPRPDYPPRSPRERGPRRSRKRGKRREDPRFPPFADFASGANSVEVNMSRRGELRGSFSGQAPSGNFGRSRHDEGRYGQSPSHANSGSSFQGSPGSQSPHGSRRDSRNDQARYSPDE